MIKVRKATEVKVKVSERLTLNFKRGWMIVDEFNAPMQAANGQYECYATKKIAQREADYLNSCL